MIKPGDAIPMKSLEVTIMTAGGAHIDRAGEPNPYCAGIAPEEGEEGEDPQSAGVLIQYGKFRFSDLGDITWNKELALLCPENRVGKVDLAITTRHGASASPKAIYAMAPRVIIMNNGPKKGGDPEAWKVLRASPGLEDMWQLHFALAGAKETNAPDTLIANLEERLPGTVPESFSRSERSIYGLQSAQQIFEIPIRRSKPRGRRRRYCRMYFPESFSAPPPLRRSHPSNRPRCLPPRWWYRSYPRGPE